MSGWAHVYLTVMDRKTERLIARLLEVWKTRRHHRRVRLHRGQPVFELTSLDQVKLQFMSVNSQTKEKPKC